MHLRVIATTGQNWNCRGKKQNILTLYEKTHEDKTQTRYFFRSKNTHDIQLVELKSGCK